MTGPSPAFILPFAERRARLLAAMPDRSAAIFPAAPVPGRNSDVEFPYRQHSDVLYLSGLREPDCVLLLRKGLDGPAFVVFLRPRNPDQEVWTGRRLGTEGAFARLGADEAHPIDELRRHLPGYLKEATTLCVAFGRLGAFQAKLDEALESLRRAKRQLWNGPLTLVDPGPLLHELRLRKGPEELAILGRAAEISVEAHRLVIERVRPGLHEYELQALIEYTFRRRGAEGWGYPPIVGAGANACVLHYVDNDARIDDGDLVLIDAGAEFLGYTADVTRTFPAGRRFTAPQRDLYAAVLDVQERLIQEVRPGMDMTRLYELAVRWLTERMVDLRLLEGPVDDRVEAKDYRRFFMHGVGHWLGLDVHDAGAYAVDGKPRPFEPGMVVTVEPGLYVPPDARKVPRRLRGLGVRIEDDVLVTEGAPEVLTAGAPKSIEAIEALRRAGRGSSLPA